MQDQEFRTEAASLWHWVSNACNNPALGDLAAQSTETLLHPGFLGSSYPIDGTGTLVIGMNPGGGTDTPNKEERDTLVAIRDQDSVAAFDRLNSVAAKLYGSWPIWRNNLLPLLKGAKVDPATVAYIHAVPFRVVDNASLAGIYKLAWAKVSSKQVALLNPGRILLAGATAGGKIQRFMPVKSRIIMRSIGDRQHADRSPKIAASHTAILSDQAFWQ